MKPDGIRTTLCFVNGMHLYEGAEVWMLEAACALRDRGRDVAVAAPSDSPLLRRARSEGFETCAVSIRLDGAPWTIARLAAFFRAVRPAAIVCNMLKDLKAAAVAGAMTGVPIRLWSRESDVPLRSGRPYYRWYLNRAATGILVNSAATRRTTMASAPWLDPARVHLLYKGVDLQRYRPLDAAPTTASPPVVGFAGSLTARKGLPTLMDAWERLDAAGRLPDGARLRLAGVGELADAVDAWRAALPHPEAVDRLGHVEDMPAFYRDIDVLAMPSRYEGYGLAAAECLATGRPVVAADVSSLPEIVTDGRNGQLIPPDDADALADALAEHLHDAALRARRGVAGRADMERGHDRERSLDLLDELTTPKGTR